MRLTGLAMWYNCSFYRGRLAQLGERYVRIVEVASSILAPSTKITSPLQLNLFPGLALALELFDHAVERHHSD